MRLSKELTWELVYLCVAIATAAHTAWALAYAFEGLEPTEFLHSVGWWGKGLMLAVAVDVGMLVASRFLASARGRWQIGSLVLAFLVAAVVSAYAQLLYIVMHTPTIQVSSGIASGFADWIKPLLDARVVLLPLALPGLALAYTFARITHRSEDRTTLAPEARIEVSMVDDTQMPLLDDPGLSGEAEDVLLRKLADRVQDGRVGEGQDWGNWSVSLRDLTWQDHARGRSYGPYKTPRSMAAAMRQVARSRVLRPDDADGTAGTAP